MTQAQATAFLIYLYDRQPVSVSKLPYSPEIRKIMDAYNTETGCELGEKRIYEKLMVLRKKQLLTRKPKLAKPAAAPERKRTP
jgi:hypothetical protein